MTFARKKLLLTSTATALIVAGGAALGYWLWAGAGSGAAATSAPQDLVVSSTPLTPAPGTGLGPGATVTISGTISNPNDYPVSVRALRLDAAAASPIAVDAAHAAAGCDAAWFTFDGSQTRFAGAAVGALVAVPAEDTISWTGATVTMTNEPSVDQGACVGATLTLFYLVGDDESGGAPAPGPVGSIDALPLFGSELALLSGTAAAGPGGEPVTELALSFAGPASGTICTVTSDFAEWACAWDTFGVPEGPYTLTLLVTDAGAQTSTVTREIFVDNTPPSGGSVDYSDGPTTASSVTISFSAPNDSGVGLDRYQLRRRAAPYSGGECQLFGQWNDLGPANPAPPSFADTTIAANFCYQYRLVGIDFAGNEGAVGSANTVVKTS